MQIWSFVTKHLNIFEWNENSHNPAVSFCDILSQNIWSTLNPMAALKKNVGSILKVMIICSAAVWILLTQTSKCSWDGIRKGSSTISQTIYLSIKINIQKLNSGQNHNFLMSWDDLLSTHSGSCDSKRDWGKPETIYDRDQRWCVSTASVPLDDTGSMCTLKCITKKKIPPIWTGSSWHLVFHWWS